MGNQRHLARLSGWPRWLMRAGVALGLLLALALAMTPASAHALPIKMSPAPHEVLRTPPGKVTITFSEALNPAAASIRVTDTTNRRVDYSDTEVADDHHTASVSLQLLKPGSYIVVWRMQSADDGHVSTGNYFFQIANLDGTVPPPPSQNPGQSSDSGAQIDGPTWLETIATFVALLALTLWAGGQIWETWVLNPAGEPDPTLRAAAQAANARFRRLGDLALAVLLIANIVVVLAQAASIAGEWGGAFAAPTLRAVLFGGRFGQLWWARQLVALAALYLPFLAERLRWTGLTRAPQRTAVTIEALPTPIASWKDELYATLRATRTLPRRLIDGLLARSPMERIMLLLALTLLTLTAFSGHAAAVTDRLWLSISVDLLHLLAEACWLGGLFYLATLLLPALRTLPPLARARVLAMGLPRFGALAIIAATLLAATGSLSTTVRLTSADQLLGTAYGRTLIIKIEIFLVMALISAYHAFVLRPRLANALTTSAKDDAVAAVAAPVAMAGDGMPEPALVMGTAEIIGDKNPLPPEVSGNANRLAGWLRREAVLGVAVLACVSLLGAFAGTLSVPVQPSAAPPAATGDFVGTQAVGPYAMKVTVSPATFGTNTVTAVLTTANTHQPVAGAGVIVTTSDLDMDMGSDHVQLQAVDGSPGTYSGSIDFAMGGRWGLTMQVLPPGGKDYLTTQFTVPVSE